METLKKKKRITLATLKAFARRNKGKLYAKDKSSFDGMEDMVTANKGAEFKPTEYDKENTGYYQTGIQGIYTVGSSGDRMTFYEDERFIGINVYNCCGESILAVKK